MKRHLVLLATLLGLVCAVFAGGEYRSVKNHFSIDFGPDWKTAASSDSTIEVALVPNSDVCSLTAFLSVCASYNAELRNNSIEDFLKITSGEVIARHVKSAPFVSDFKLLQEGKAKLGKVQAYEVLMRYTTPVGARYRRTFMTFNKGYMYNISFHSTPESFESDYDVAKKVLATFDFTR